MVHIRDEGVFDAPVEKIWRYINDEHGAHSHGSVKVTGTRDQTEKGLTLDLEVKRPDGSTHAESWKITMNPPTSMYTEVLSGPMKGSKHTHTYTAMGPKTKVVVEGEFIAQGLDDASTKKAVLAMLETVFNEDNANLQKFK
jgi:ligand-binding SRPBCC domain-containing protein